MRKTTRSLCSGPVTHNLSQTFGRFLRLLPAVQCAKHDACLAIDQIIHRVRKAFREQAMKLEHLNVNPGVEFQRVDIGKKCVEKTIAEAFSLPRIESPPAVEILERRRQNRYPSLSAPAQFAFRGFPLDRLLLARIVTCGSLLKFLFVPRRGFEPGFLAT
jgi:hypothetical protein